MEYLNNFYFKMLVKSAKMTHNLNDKNTFNEIIGYFNAAEPTILPHVWLTYHIEKKWREVYLKLIKDHFIKDTIYLVKSVANVDIDYNIIEHSFNARTIFSAIFATNGLYGDKYNKFYYK